MAHMLGRSGRKNSVRLTTNSKFASNVRGMNSVIMQSTGRSFVQDLGEVKNKNGQIVSILRQQKADDVQELLQTAEKVQQVLERVFARSANSTAQNVLQSQLMHEVVEKLGAIVGDYYEVLKEVADKHALAKQLQSSRARRKFEQFNSMLIVEATILDELSDDMLATHDKNYQKLPDFRQEREEKVEILDPEGYRMWVDLFGDTVFMADVSKVVKGLMRQLNVSMSSAERKIILQVLDPSNTGQISSLRWNEFLKGFGPMSRCLQNLQEMLAQPWFHGFLSRDDATKLLEVEPRGTFMVRFSSTKAGSFALAHTMENNKVNHVIIYTRENGFVVREDNAREKLFASISHLIDAYRSMLTQPYVQTFPRQLWWHGDITGEDATKCLQGKKPGTFLIRFSATQRGCFASSYVDKSGVIEKGLIVGSPTGYTLSGKSFSSMEEIVDSLIQWGIFTEPYKNTTNEVNDKMRFKIVSEIVTTEATYVRSLEVLAQLFLPAFRENPKINPKDTQVIFCNCEALLTLHRQFLMTLERTLEYWDPDDTALGPHFLQLYNQLPPVYSLYVNNYQDAVATFEKIRANKDGAAFIQQQLQQNIDPKIKQNQMSGYLILPVQRIPRYILLLTDLIKHTNGAHTDYDDLCDAVANIKAAADAVNESKRVVEDAEDIRKMQTKIDGLEESLAVLGRRLLKEGKLTPMESEKSKDYYCFLFNDLLLITKKKSSTKYKLKDTYNLQNTRVVDVPDAGGQENCFRLCSVGSTDVTLASDTPQEKGDWFNAFKTALSKLEDGKERTLSMRRPR